MKLANRGIKLQIASAVTSIALIAGTTATAFGSSEPIQVEADDAVDGGEVAKDMVSSPRAAAYVRGVFAYSQHGPLATAEEIAQTFKDSRRLCGAGKSVEATKAADSASAQDWTIGISGAVKNSFTASVGALAASGSEVDVIGCACGAAPNGEARAVRAEVSGVSVQRLLAQAVPTSEANAVTFIGADGTKATLPLWYMFAHSAIIASEIAGEPVEASMGATVQLWVESAPGWCFVKDVVSIEVSCESETPAAPDAVEELETQGI